jgi:sugar lactone lactonase YvrE
VANVLGQLTTHHHDSSRRNREEEPVSRIINVRRRHVGVAAGAAVAIAASMTATVAAGPSASAAVPTLSAVRSIGGPGHAENYGWGAETIPPGVRGAGNVLISDYWNSRVTEFDRQGRVVAHVITKNNTTHQAPYDVAVNPVNGNIAVGDVDGGGTVDIYTRGGALLRQCGATSRWNYPAYLDYNAQGRLAVADSRGHKIVVVDDSTCNVTAQFGPNVNVENRTTTPRGIDFAPDGTLWVANNGTHRIVQWELAGSAASVVNAFDVRGNDFRGLLFNQANSLLYLVNAAASSVDVYDTAGNMVDTFGRRGVNNGQFIDGGRGIARDGAGNIWVGDMPNFRTQVFTPGGAFVREAPVGAGPPPVGRYNQPQDVAVMPDGTVAGLDTFNWRVNVHRPNGTAFAFGNRLRFNYPRGIAADRRNGDWIIANSDSKQVDRYTASGTLLWSKAAEPWSVAVDQTNGLIYAVEDNSTQVRVWADDGSRVRTLNVPQLVAPRGVTVDPVDRTLWIANWGSGEVVHVNATTGAVINRFATGAAGLSGIEVDRDTVYVSAKLGNHIKMFSKAGVAQGQFGSSGGTLGRFRAPTGLDLVNGSLYVMESGNERIQVLRINR